MSAGKEKISPAFGACYCITTANHRRNRKQYLRTCVRAHAPARTHTHTHTPVSWMAGIPNEGAP